MPKFKYLLAAFCICLTALVLSIAACKKDNRQPLLTITAPLQGTAVSLSDSLLITGEISDDVDLHELDIIVTDSTGDTVFYSSPYVHGAKEETYGVKFGPPAVGIYIITVTIYDHDLAYTQLSRTINVFTPPTLTVNQPIDSTTILFNDSLHITGSVSDEKGLLYMVLAGINDRTGDTVAIKGIPLNNATTFNFDTYLPQPEKDSFNLNVIVVNHYNFVTRQSIRYYVQ